MNSIKESVKKKTLLGYELTAHQDAWLNYLLPSICSCVLYTLLIASDVAVIISHHRNGDPIWSSLTLFFMYLPVLGSFIIIISNWELWPEFEGCGRDNIIWFWTKVSEHLLFPIWSMARFAEKIFWSIEAVRAKDEFSIEENLSIPDRPRSIELYIFLQSYVHSLPQILLQFYILIRHNTDIQRETAYGQSLSIIFNLLKLSVTTTFYQRFRSQKLTGKQYPWYKTYKVYNTSPAQVTLRSQHSRSRPVVDDRRNTSKLEDTYSLEPPAYYSERRRSSDIYLEPSTSDDNKRQTLLETDFDEEIRTKVKDVDGIDEVDTEINKDLPKNTSDFQRETSVLDGPKRNIYRETVLSERSEPDFNVSRIISVKGLEDDDVAGKLVATLWWFSFLLTRVLAISMFAYFFMKATICLISLHYIFVIAILLYDVKSDAVKRAKAIFFIFIGYVYIFCIIEFKLRFKKATFIYYGFFVLVFIENLGMCLVWYIGKIEYLENDFWCRYAFYTVSFGSIISFSSMVFYLIINKPKKVVVETKKQTPR